MVATCVSVVLEMYRMCVKVCVVFTHFYNSVELELDGGNLKHTFIIVLLFFFNQAVVYIQYIVVISMVVS